MTTTSENQELVLHGYWRSGTSYRARIALNVKNVRYRQVTYDLRDGAHRSPNYLALNPQGLVPALECNGQFLTQSSAIIEWLEECYPSPPLLPNNPDHRATVRAMTMIIACDVHPLNNLRVLDKLRSHYAADDASISEWIAGWIHPGFAALEKLIATFGRGFAFGDQLTLADCHLVPQVYSAERFNIDLTDYPRILAAVEKARNLDPVRSAHPANQVDASSA